VKYLCHTKNGKSFRNVEYLRIKNGQLESIECYFRSTIQLSVSSKHRAEVTYGPAAPAM
jgi:hypothetical protein